MGGGVRGCLRGRCGQCFVLCVFVCVFMCVYVCIYVCVLYEGYIVVI